jgi:hypothetical protein
MKQYKLFQVRNYIKAASAKEAIRKDKTYPVDDVWVDEDWKKGNNSILSSAIGFTTEDTR